MVLALESLLLFASLPFPGASNSIGLYLASTAMGLQNGMVSAYSGALIRTTHVTGLFTELGIYPGHMLRGLPVDRLRLRICLLVAATFMLGSAAGALLFERMHNLAVLVPAMLTGACGLCYGVYRQYSTAEVSSTGQACFPPHAAVATSLSVVRTHGIEMQAGCLLAHAPTVTSLVRPDEPALMTTADL